MDLLRKILSNSSVRLILISLALMLIPLGVLKALATATVADGGIMGFLVYVFNWADVVLQPIGAMMFLFAVYRVRTPKKSDAEAGN